MFRALLGLLRRWRIEGVLTLTLALGLAGALNLARDIGRPLGGSFVWHNPGRNAWQLDVRYLVPAFPLTHAYVILRYQTSRSAKPCWWRCSSSLAAP